MGARQALEEHAVKLVMSIVRDQDAGRVIDALVAREFRATRRAI